MSTVNDLLQQARAQSSFNDPGIVTNGEAVRRVQTSLRSLYQLAVTTAIQEGLEPSYFGTSTAVQAVAGVFTVPSDCILDYRWEQSDGTEVRMIESGELSAELPPRLFRLGRTRVSPGRTGDPAVAETLTVYYARTHPDLDPSAALDASANTLDASWPTHHDALLIADLALFIAKKDGRDTEVAMLKGEIEGLTAIFQQDVVAQSYRTVNRDG